MILKNINYNEYVGEDKEWFLHDCGFDQINLLVGKNATGKSRTISVIKMLAMIFSGENPRGFDSGSYDVVLEDNQIEYRYLLKCKKGIVLEEVLRVNGEIKLKRIEDGTGSLFYDQLQQSVNFKIPTGLISLAHNQDELQHPFLIKLSAWGKQVANMPFGTKLGQEHFMTSEQIVALESNPLIRSLPKEAIIEDYIIGYTEFKESFDTSILSDMKTLGYNLTDVGSSNIDFKIPGLATTLFGMFVQEEGLPFKVFQQSISAGMFRALTLVIYINYCVFMKKRCLILIDDIGEGLDFIRAKAVVKLLVEKAKSSGIQVIMSSNDQFTMNYVPLENWTILRRSGSVVKAFNSKNSANEFNKFKFMGLNNFDFFASEVLG